MRLSTFADAAYNAYRGKATWNLPRDTEVNVEHHPEGILLAVRGTELDPYDIKSDLESYWAPWEFKDDRSLALLHHGFAQSAREVFRAATDRFEKDYPIFLTGHSLGGAAALLAAAMLLDHGYNVRAVVTFGSPRPGDSNLKKWLEKRTRVFRVVNAMDIVTGVPFWLWGFRHVGKLIYLYDKGVDFQPSFWNRAWHRLRARRGVLGAHSSLLYRSRCAMIPFDVMKGVSDD